MRPKNALKKLGPLLNRPRFTSEEAKSKGVTSATLVHYVKQGEIKRIGRGIYRGKNAPVSDVFQWEDLVEAIQKTKGGVVCLISALAIYELTDQLPRQFWIAIDHRTIHRTRKSTKVVRFRNMKIGKTKIKFGKISIPIFDRERTIVDSFRHLSMETAIKALKEALALKGENKIDMKKLANYAKKLRFDIQPYVMAITTV